LRIQEHNQTSTGIPLKNSVFDRESGKDIVVHFPSFDLIVSNYSLSLSIGQDRLPLNRMIALLKCLVMIQSLPEAGLEEAVEGLERVADFYTERSTEANVPTIPASSIRGKIRAAQVRPPIVLEP
jgi:hypothetical protein